MRQKEEKKSRLICGVFGCGLVSYRVYQGWEFWEGEVSYFSEGFIVFFFFYYGLR